MTGVRPSSPERLLATLRRRVADERVIAAMASVPRECFVRDSEQRRAYGNHPLSIGCGQTISQPLVVARMCELLQPGQHDRVLDVGTGSGYHAAILAKLAAHVWSVERHPELVQQARENLRTAAIDNVTLVTGDGSLGLAAEAPFDAINVGAAAAGQVPRALEQQLALGGRLVVPVDLGEAGERLVLVSWTPCGLVRRALEAVRFVPLVRGEDAPE
jgi:protein-L-isoaspartate(D-aspartate) O-methyltransferase